MSLKVMYLKNFNSRLINFIKNIIKWKIYNYRISLKKEINESIRINNFLKKNKNETVLIVHDLISSPPTFGDFIQNIMLFKYFEVLNYNVEFILIDGKFREDWLLNKKQIKNLLNNKKEIFLKLTENSLNYKEINWSQFSDLYLNKKKYFISFKERIVQRKSIYNLSGNLLNILIANLNNDLINNFLIKKNIKYTYLIPLPKLNYITWHVRYNSNWANDRNINEFKFLEIHNTLSEHFLNKKIMIVSDQIGVDTVKKWSLKNKIDLLFSQDYSKTFIGNSELILSSDFYFQYRGGGIGMIPVYSHVPYLIIDPMANEKMWSKNKMTSWANKFQIRYELTDFPTLFLNKYLKYTKIE